MLLAIGDLVEDVVVRLGTPVRRGTDTVARTRRRQGGSASNVAVSAARATGAARFIGQVGDDPTGRSLVASLDGEGVDTRSVRTGGTTGTIIVLVDPDGERTMLTDRRSCLDLADPDPTWLEGIGVLHLPLYSLVDGTLASTSRTCAGWAHERGIDVSVDLSSIALLDRIGAEGLELALTDVHPDVVFANVDEATALADLERTRGDLLAGVTRVVKRGADPCDVTGGDDLRRRVPPPERLTGVDTTGAGDAFAAGFLTADQGGGWRRDPVAAARAGHDAAARLLRGR